MKKKLSFILCALTLTVMVQGMPVHAEDNNNNMNGNNNNEPMTRNMTTAAETNQDTNWEWLGLLGLVGLLGLRRRERETH
jgi:MYXO-CTERM domain-containing protein